jgi:WD40 repeat protein
LAVSVSNNLIAYAKKGLNNFDIWLMNLKDLSIIRGVGSVPSEIGPVEISPNGKYLAAGAANGNIYVYDIIDKTLLKTLSHSNMQIGFLQLKFTPNSGFLVSSGGGGSTLTPGLTKIWSLNNYQQIYQYNHGTHYCIDISSDSLFIAICRSYQIQLLNTHWTSTGIQDPPYGTYQLIYPNPSNDNITIHIKPGIFPSEINLTDINGIIVNKIINIQASNDNVNIDISSLPNGTYFITVVYPNQKINYKFQKKG